MQTFLPWPDFGRSANCLDRLRLGKQRVETLQILKTLATDHGSGAWANHPAVRMWKGHELVLIQYGQAICGQWTDRGYQDSCAEKISKYKSWFKNRTSPKWLGNDDFHLAHRSNLLRKFPQHYTQFFEPGLKPDLSYIWPTQMKEA